MLPVSLACGLVMNISLLIIEINKGQIAYVPLDPVADYVHILDLNTRLRIGWKTLPNLNFKLKFQTQISNSNLNLINKNIPLPPG